MTPKQAYELATLFILRKKSLQSHIDRIDRQMSRHVNENEVPLLKGAKLASVDHLNDIITLEAEVKRILNLG